MKRVLILGAGGQLGMELAKVFPDALLLSHSTGVHVVNAEDFHALESIFQSFSPEIVINASAKTNVDGCETNKNEAFEANALAVKNIVTLCRKHSAMLYHISTDYVFDGITGNYTESSLQNPINYYGFSKAIGDAYASCYDHSLIIRTSGVYGHSNNFPKFVHDSLHAGKEVRVIHSYYSPIHARSLAEAINYIIGKHQDLAGTINIAGEKISRVKLAFAIARKFGFDDSLIREVVTLPGMIAKRPFDSSLNLELSKQLIKENFYSTDRNLQYLQKSEEKENNSNK